jgi:hypothetical protein
VKKRGYLLRVSLASSALLLTSCSSAIASFGNAAPAPGTATQVTSLVSASVKILKLSNTTVPSLSGAPTNTFGNTYPYTDPSCSTMTRCDFGDLTSKKIVVLFGDSHARMWATSVIPELKVMKYKLVILWRGLCAAASLDMWNPITNSIDPQCKAWRTQMINLIQGTHPSLVLVSNATSRTATATTSISSADWTTGLVKTINALKSAATKVAVIGDPVSFTYDVPSCLATYPSKVQFCSVKSPNPSKPAHRSAEIAAAKDTSVPYIDTLSWLCRSSCSPVIGNMIVYSDSNHLTYTYAKYLSKVMGLKLKPLL